MFASAQGSLFGGVEPSIGREFPTLGRVDLDDEAWVDYAPNWLAGDDTLFELLAGRAAWSSPEVKMYDQIVQTPRLTAPVDAAWHPVLGEIVEALSARYGRRLVRISAGLYRDGRDSVAWHGDRIARERAEAIVATVSLGSPRRFLMRPKGGGPSRSWSLGHGDLVVMGGAAQRTWEHTIPKVSAAAPRMAVMFRHAYD